MSENQLNERRKKASDQSLGLSHQVIYEKAQDILQAHLNNSSHLDFGSGQGRLLEALKKQSPGAQLFAIDLMERPENFDPSIDWQSCDLNGKLPYDDDKFTSVSAIEIIEHLENPRHVFRELYRVLKPGGFLLLSTPNNESWRSLISYVSRGHFVAFTDRSYPAHITALNRKDLSRCSFELGFSQPSWIPSGRGCVPGLTSQTWQGVTLGILDGLRYSDNIFMCVSKP